MPTYQATGAGRAAAAGDEEQAEPAAPDPSGQKPHGYYRDCFFGTLAPIARQVEWSGHQNTVSLRILEADEARQCSHFAYVRSEGHPDSDEYLQARTIFHIALCLVSVDGVALDTECKTLEQRLQLAAELPDTLQDAIIAAYDEARFEPIAFLQEMQQDPISGRAPMPTGSSSAPEVTPAGV